MDELQKLCEPIANYLRKHCDPYCTVVIKDGYIKLVRDEMCRYFEQKGAASTSQPLGD